MGFLNGSPEQERHSAEIIALRVRTTVFIDERVLELDGEDARNRLVSVKRDAYLQSVTKGFDQIPEPFSRLGRKSVPFARHYEQSVKVTQERIRKTVFVNQFFFFSATNFALNRILVEFFEDRVEVRSQVNPLKTIRLSRLKQRSREIGVREGTQLDIAQFFLP